MKVGTIYNSEDWQVEVGVDGYISVIAFSDCHYYGEIVLQVKDGEVKVVKEVD